ncbi:MAG: hypothetical protein KAT16_02985 [Candidatus Heimdallarchaeota archaeon]|nr:hypothetical protein [Candidatus Heimdallarchaeota archaeon]
MNDLKKIGRTLLGLGALLMLLFGIIFVIINRLTEIGQISGIDLHLHSLNITLASYTLGVEGWSVSGNLTIVAGLFGIYGYKSLNHLDEKRDMAFTWGANGIILGLVGGTLGGFIILFAGIILILDYFSE